LWREPKDAAEGRKEEERRQAEQITAWIDLLPDGEDVLDGEMAVKLIIQNASDQVVYFLVASVVNANTEVHVGNNENFRNYIGRVPPGRNEYKIQHPGQGMHKKYSIELAFQDAVGRRWVRRGKGGLQQIYIKNRLPFTTSTHLWAGGCRRLNNIHCAK
jgi:hypothetical protein